MKNYPISKKLLLEFMEGFYGYGNLDSPFWFIGKEEGGGKDIEENYRRVLTWETQGKNTTVDMIDYHIELGFSERSLNSIQSTWTKLVQILLKIEQKPSDKENRRHYQRHNFGRLSGDNCELELMPLASRSTGGKWHWEDIFKDYFGIYKRKDYFLDVVPKRILRLKELIAKHHPKLVVFYSTDKSYIEKWSKIAGSNDWNWVQVSNVMRYGWIKKDSRLYVITTHPTMKGITNNDFPKVGQFIEETTRNNDKK